MKINRALVAKKNIKKMKHYILIAEEGERSLIEKYLPECDWEVIVTGVGGVNIIRSLQHVDRDSEVLNIGYAGSSNFEIGSLVEVTESRVNHPNCSYPEPTLPLDKIPDEIKVNSPRIQAVCYSNTDFVLASDYKDCAFDMELAFIAAMDFRKTYALKLVSDNLSLHAYHELTHGVE